MFRKLLFNTTKHAVRRTTQFRHTRTLWSKNYIPSAPQISLHYRRAVANYATATATAPATSTPTNTAPFETNALADKELNAAFNALFRKDEVKDDEPTGRRAKKETTDYDNFLLNMKKEFEKSPTATQGKTLVHFYSKDKNMDVAFDVFSTVLKSTDNLKKYCNQNKSEMSAILKKLVHTCLACKKPEKTIPLFNFVEEYNLKMDHYLIAALLKASAVLSDQQLAKRIYEIIKSKEGPKLNLNPADFASLTQAYTNGPNPNWNTAFEIFEYAKKQDMVSDAMLIMLLNGCAQTKNLDKGQDIHEFIKKGESINIALSNALINMYGKCGKVDQAQQVYDQIQDKNYESFTFMAAAFEQNSKPEEAAKVNEDMREKGVVPPPPPRGRGRAAAATATASS